jgi:hypothetical protein
MRYHEYLRLGKGIGGGAVESAHRQVVDARMRHGCMATRWRGTLRYHRLFSCGISYGISTNDGYNDGTF